MNTVIVIIVVVQAVIFGGLAMSLSCAKGYYSFGHGFVGFLFGFFGFLYVGFLPDVRFLPVSGSDANKKVPKSDF